MKINFSLSLKITLIIVLFSALVVTSITYLNINEQITIFEKSYSDKATALAQALDASIGSRDELTDQNKLHSYILRFFYLNTEISKISINLPDEDDEGKLKVFASSDSSTIGTYCDSNNDVSYEDDKVVKIPDHGEDFHTLTVITPIRVSGQIYGTYELVFSMDAAYTALDARVKNFVTISMIFFIFLVVGLLYFLRKTVVKPIVTFRDAARSVGEGKLDTEVKIKSRDELGELALAFNQMTKDLEESSKEIEKYSKTLESQVEERTKELETSREELRKKVDALEKNKKALLNIMWDLRRTISALENAEKHIKEQNINLTKAQKELSTLNMELEEKVKERTNEIEKLLKQKDEFISQLGHDLKNPLTPLVGLLPIIENKETDPKTKEHLRVIIRNVEYMRDLVIKTLQLARINSPLTKLDITDIDLSQEMKDVIDNQQLLFKEHNIILDNKISEDVFVKGDKIRIDELISNLFTNSLKYTPDGGTITVNAQKDDEFVIISIKDTGIGMSKDQITKIFDEFYKADESRHEMDSSGLGLSICKRIVERHGGKIWAESEGIGKGSIIYFKLKMGEIKKEENAKG